ncbi:unnamed protein product [Malus baccata var. baccata]
MQLQYLAGLLFLSTHPATPLNFNFPSFPNGISNISLDEQAFIGDQFIQLTSSGAADDSKSRNLGRATYYKPFLLRQRATGKLADFTTNFTFVIDLQGKHKHANGLTFFLAPFTYNRKQGMDRRRMDLPYPPYVEVEFDIYQNNQSDINDPVGKHVGIDINSVMSKITMPWNGSIVDGKINSARVNYDSTAKNLSVAFTSYVNGIHVMRYLDYSINVNDYLRDRMPKSSLDCHLFKEKNILSWEVRYKIAQGLASGLLYLHQEWEQCVLHRDIKSSNLMLDSNFNAKLGDFGLARLVDHGKEPKTTALAGTMGYMAPEYIITGKASKESDVYSFGNK